MTVPGAGPLRVGVIGAGAMGAAHAAMLTDQVPGAAVVRVFDPDQDRCRAVAEASGAAQTDGAAEVVTAEDVEALLIAAPDALHEELALAGLAVGKPTLCEKPLATSPAGSLRVVHAEAATGRRLVQVGFMRRFDPGYAALRKGLDEGAVGLIRTAHCIHRNARAHPDATSEGVLVNSMIHEFDIVPWLLGDRVAAVTVHAARVPDGHLRDVQVAVLETRGGVVVTVEVSVNARYGYDVRAEILGTEGTLRLNPPSPVAIRCDGLDALPVAPGFVERFSEAYRLQLVAWVRAARAGRVTGPSAWDGHVANLVAEAAVESLRGAGRVEVPQDAPVPTA